jgi:UDP-glucuronate 4-epimerase
MHLIACIEQNLGIISKKNFVRMQAGDVPATYADVEDLVRDCGFKPGTSIEKGVERFVSWYKGFNRV